MKLKRIELRDYISQDDFVSKNAQKYLLGGSGGGNCCGGYCAGTGVTYPTNCGYTQSYCDEANSLCGSGYCNC